MNLPTVNAKSVWIAKQPVKSATYAAHAAKDAGYQFFIYDSKLFMLAYWRDEGRFDFIELVVDKDDIATLLQDIRDKD